MNRRQFLKSAAALPLLTAGGAALARPAVARVRPTDAAWPSPASWERLGQQTGGRLVQLRSPFATCRDAPVGPACRQIFRELKNPYYIGDDPALTQTMGWIDAWASAPSAYCVAAETAADVAAAVAFARDNNLRLVVKGGGHSYLGTSNAPDSLLIWTHPMKAITLHDAFVPQGCEGRLAALPAVSVGAGAIWMHTYNEVTTMGGRYVQGGGCGTVGVAGLVLGGGFGSYSKTYGTAAASLLEAEIVMADGVVRVVNACVDPELFWALKGGGGGSFGVVTRLTLRTHDLPKTFGFLGTRIHAASDTAFRKLIARFVVFYAENLLNPRWGEIVTLRPGREFEVSMSFQDLDAQEADAIWRPFFAWVATDGSDLAFLEPPRIIAGPPRHRWDPAFLKARVPGAVISDDRPGAPGDNVFWSANLGEAGHFIEGFESAWLPAELLAPDKRETLADALFAAARLWSVELHFQKGLAGAPAATIAAAADTATNPAVLDAFVLAIIAGETPPAYPGLPGYAPDLDAARHSAAQIAAAMAELRKVAPLAGSYVAESSYFERQWQQSYWGSHYPRLLAIKQAYDPDGLFFVRHGVGSEGWSDDGFTRAT
ncbi:MAG TPA: FAD-binding protein [Stellaceae bacterium]|nr:FAD-binding protein [Stellaceae bacterium]